MSRDPVPGRTVAFDASAIRPRAGGMGVVATELLRGLQRQDPAGTTRWLLLHPRPAELPSDLRDLPVASGPSGLRTPTELWRALVAPRLASHAGATAVVWATGRGASPRGPRGLALVHDLLPLHNVPWRPLDDRLLVAPALRRSLRHADHVVTISHEVARQVAGLARVPTAGVSVVPNGVRELFHRPADPEMLSQVRDRYAPHMRIWLHVGRLDARRNAGALVRGFAIARRWVEGPPPVLVLCGPSGRAAPGLARLARRLGVADRLHIAGYVPDGELRGLYEASELLACVSLHEGFGLPVAEAMAAGLPVLSSGHGGLLELHGRAAQLVDPRSPQAIARGLARLGNDAARRAALSAAARTRARALCWDATAGAWLRLLGN